MQYKKKEKSRKRRGGVHRLKLCCSGRDDSETSKEANVRLEFELTYSTLDLLSLCSRNPSTGAAVSQYSAGQHAASYMPASTGIETLPKVHSCSVIVSVHVVIFTTMVLIPPASGLFSVYSRTIIYYVPFRTHSKECMTLFSSRNNIPHKRRTVICMW